MTKNVKKNTKKKYEAPSVEEIGALEEHTMQMGMSGMGMGMSGMGGFS